MSLKLKVSSLALALGLATCTTHAVETPRFDSFFQKENLIENLAQWKNLTLEQQQTFITKLDSLKLALILTVNDLSKNDLENATQNFNLIIDIETKEDMIDRRKAQPYCF